jgi:FMN phosphatase YigB (HAD superfamily)
MKVANFYRLDTLLRRADKLAAGCDTISFDLFDTLLVRRVHFPDLLKTATARHVAALAGGRGRPVRWQQVQRVRDRCEAQQRRQTAARFADHEARYPDFMGRALAELFGGQADPALLQRVTDYEIGIENAMLVPRRSLVDWLRRQHGAGKRILVLSDVYLPSDLLRRLIAHAGFLACVHRVHSSADDFLAKASGQAFRMLRDTLGLETDRWLHIGDNPISDGLRPAALGIRALVLKDVSERRRKLVARSYTAAAGRRPFWKGRLLQQFMLPLEGENTPCDPLYLDGYHFLGPLVGCFIVALMEKVAALGIRRLYFLSREGWIFQRCWERIAPWLRPAEQLPRVSYLYVSRRALAGPTCTHQGLSPENADIGLLSPSNRDLGDLFRLFGLEAEALRPHLARHGLAIDEALSPLYAPRPEAVREKFQTLLADADFQQAVKLQSRPAGEALQRYLEGEGFFEAPRVALVDVGWLGTIPRFLFEAVKHRPDRPRLHAFLMGASRGIPYPDHPDHSVEGLIYDQDRFDFAGSLMTYNLDLFEEAFRAPHPGLIGYRPADPGESPLLFRAADTDAAAGEERESARYAPLRQGMIDAAGRFAAAAAVLGYGSVELRPWINHLLVSRLAFPGSGEVARLRHRYHFDDFGAGRPLPRQVLRAQRHLWYRSLTALRWNPWLRLRYFIGHALNMLQR